MALGPAGWCICYCCCWHQLALALARIMRSWGSGIGVGVEGSLISWRLDELGHPVAASMVSIEGETCLECVEVVVDSKYK